jgi:hypothetical protein
MLRIALAALAMLATSACSYGSAVNLAPMNARLARAELAPGDYCEVKGEGPFQVISSEDCAPLTWDQSTRTYTMVDKEDADESVRAAIVSLGAGLFLAQVEAKEKNTPDRYQIQLFLSTGNAFLMLPALEDEPLAKLAAKHRRVSFKKDHSGRLYIATGSPDRIKDFLREAAHESLRIIKEKDKQDEVSIGVLDRMGAPDHAATADQIRDIEAVRRTFAAMRPK